MDQLRNLTVLEHEVISVVEDAIALNGTSKQPDINPWLSVSEANALLRLNSQRRGFCESVPGGVKLSQHCGILRLQSCVLEILPKVGFSDNRSEDELARSRAALLTMLHHAQHLTITKMDAAPQRVLHAPLLDVFIEAFLNCALELARRGLLFRYVPRADDLSVVKGRFHTQGHIRRNLARPHLLHCEYEEFTDDNAYNRAIRATLDACRTFVRLPHTHRLWFETHARFASASPTRMSTTDVARLPRDRTTRHYATALTWCEWLLAMTSPAMSSGDAYAPGLLFDMNKLFEAYVSRREEEAAGNEYVVCRQGPREALGTWRGKDAFQLNPDITIWRATTDGPLTGIVRILDAKWKRLNPNEYQYGIKEADVYQLLSYALHYRCRSLELVYPAPRSGIREFEDIPPIKISAPGFDQQIEISIKAVPLWTSIHES